MSDIVKTIRFKKAEWKLIQEFLQKNTLFDFSTLTRTSLSNFIKNPDLKIHPVSNGASVSTVGKTASQFLTRSFIDKAASEA